MSFTESTKTPGQTVCQDQAALKTSAVGAEYLTVEQLAAMLQVPVKHIRKYSMRIPGYTKVGHLVRYRRTSVAAALAGGNLIPTKGKA